MKKFWLASTLLVLGVPLFGQTPPLVGSYHMLRGTVGGTQATMAAFLPDARQKSEASSKRAEIGLKYEGGFYSYDMYKKHIPLQSEYSPQGYTLTELLDGKNTGIFQGVWEGGNTFTGVWTDPGTQKKFPFHFTLVSEFLAEKIPLYKMEREEILAGSEFRVNVQAPLIDNPKKDKVLEIINRSLGGIAVGTEEALLNSRGRLLEDWYSYWKNLPPNSDGGGQASFTHESQVFLNYIDTELIAFSDTGQEYSGGAHGLSWRNSKIYSLRTGDPINKISLLIKNENDPALVALIHRKLRDWAGGSKDSFFQLESVRLNDNFFIDTQRGGLTFVYNQYEIGPYAMGMPEITVTFAELSPFLKKENPFAHLFL